MADKKEPNCSTKNGNGEQFTCCKQHGCQSIEEKGNDFTALDKMLKGCAKSAACHSLTYKDDKNIPCTPKRRCKTSQNKET